MVNSINIKFANTFEIKNDYKIDYEFEEQRSHREDFPSLFKPLPTYDKSYQIYLQCLCIYRGDENFSLGICWQLIRINTFFFGRHLQVKRSKQCFDFKLEVPFYWYCPHGFEVYKMFFTLFWSVYRYDIV